MTSFLGYTCHHSYLSDIARGLVPGASTISSFGERATAGSTTNVLVHPTAIGDTLVVPPSPGVQMQVVSSSANDTAAGTGIRSLHMHYLDGNLDSRDEVITLAGLTPVNTAATDIRFVQCLHINTTGSGGVAAGNITMSNGGTTYSYIKQGERRCTSSARRVPRGKILIVSELWCGSASSTAGAEATFRFVTTEFENHDYTEAALTIPRLSISLQDNGWSMVNGSSFSIPSGAIAAFTVTTSLGAVVSAGFAGHYENITILS